MSESQANPLDTVLVEGAVTIQFQPIYSIRQRRIIGLEALARPDALNVKRAFALAQDTSVLLQLDRLCRELAISSYAGLPSPPPPTPKPLLFLNFESSVIDTGVEGSGALLQAILCAGVDPQQVVIEINESLVRDSQALSRFVQHHHRHGFLIALDDLGAGHSSLARIAQLRPQILKLDRSLITGLDRSFVQQQTVKSLVRLGKGIGALVLAEGLETLDEVDHCAALGVDLFQGFVFSRPVPADALSLNGEDPRLLAAAGRLRQQAVANLQERQRFKQRIEALTAWSCNDLLRESPQQFAVVLAAILERDPDLEAVYLLDGQGQQVGSTFLGAGCRGHRNGLFSPTEDGSDHSSKEYFYSLVDTGLRQFTTDSYISMATGNLCRTVATVLTHGNGATYVLCLDITENAITR